MMSDEFMPFWTLLSAAEDQLQWGTDPDNMEAIGRALAKRRPASVVAESLMERADYLRALRCQSSTMRGKFAGVIPRTGSLQTSTSASKYF